MTNIGSKNTRANANERTTEWWCGMWWSNVTRIEIIISCLNIIKIKGKYFILCDVRNDTLYITSVKMSLIWRNDPDETRERDARQNGQVIRGYQNEMMAADAMEYTIIIPNIENISSYSNPKKKPKQSQVKWCVRAQVVHNQQRMKISFAIIVMEKCEHHIYLHFFLRCRLFIREHRLWANWDVPSNSNGEEFMQRESFSVVS